MNSGKSSPKSLAMNVTAMLIFGTIGVFRRYIPVSSAFLAVIRGLLGGMTIFAFTKMTRRVHREKISRRRFLWFSCSGALMGINWMLLFEAFNHTTVAVATLCYYMQPTIVVLLSPLLFKEKLTVKKAACSFVAIAGMVLLSGIVGGESSDQQKSVQGILLGLGAAVFYSAVIIMNKKVTGVDAYQKTTVQLLSAGVVMIPYLLLTGINPDGGSLSATMILLLLTVGILHTGVAYLLYFGSMDGLRVQSVAIFSYIDPVSALFFSAVFLREPLSAPGIVGAVMIIGSAVIGEFKPCRRSS